MTSLREIGSKQGRIGGRNFGFGPRTRVRSADVHLTETTKARRVVGGVVGHGFTFRALAVDGLTERGVRFEQAAGRAFSPQLLPTREEIEC